MNYWLHRISHEKELSYPLLQDKERRILSTGWSGFCDEQSLDRYRQEREIFEDKFNSEEWGWLRRRRHGLWRFISEMKKDDYVLVPSWGVFSIYKIVDDRPFCAEKLDLAGLKDWGGNEIGFKDGYLYRRDNNLREENIDLGFFRKIEPVVEGVSRGKYAGQALISRMKYRGTNACITDLKNNIEDAIKRSEDERPIDLQESVLGDPAKRVLELIHEQLDDVKFEQLIKWYFEKLGASNVIIPSKNARNEGDADIVATFEEIKTMIYVQVKKHDGKTNSWALQQINEYKNSKDETDDGYASGGWVISSADEFTEDCEEAARRSDVVLINGRKLVERILKVGISDLDKAFFPPKTESAS